MAEAGKQIRLMGLRDSITRAFTNLNAAQLREWYVETFVLDVTNLHSLLQIGKVERLEDLDAHEAWPSVEHWAIGYRLLFMQRPNRLAAPNFLNPENWRSIDPVTQVAMRMWRPWEQIRYDPASENWYQKVDPGQWQRLAKGKQSEAMVERRIRQWLKWMDHDNLDTYQYLGYNPISAEALEAIPPEQAMALLEGSKKGFRKFSQSTATPINIRKVLEGEPIMWLDSTTLNRVRTLTPFANGMLSLVRWEFIGTENESHVVKQGQLIPMDPEFMVTNANSLPWHDPDKNIPNVIELIEATGIDKDWSFVEAIEDELILRCPTYWSFLTKAFPEYDERSAFLRLLGAAMYGTNLKIIAAMIGEPNAGKDTVINWLSYLMPGQVANLPFSAFTPYGDEDRGFAPLMGARVATVSGEVGEGRGSKLLAEKIKTVSSGGGTLRVAEKYEKPTTIFFDGMLFLQGNSVPTIAGGDKALYTNRLVAVEFKHPFPLQARSYEAQYRAEASTFAQVLFLNYLRYMDKGGGMLGIDPPKSWRNFRKEFENAANPHGYIEQSLTYSDEPVSTQQFHQALNALDSKLGKSSHGDRTPHYWTARMKAAGFPPKDPKVRNKVAGQWVYFLTLDADKSDGVFNQSTWDQCLQDAAVTS